MNEYGCRDAPCEKSWKQGNPLSNTIKDTSTVTLFRQRVTHDCASILDSIANGISLFPRFFAWCIPTFIFIKLNDFTLVYIAVCCIKGIANEVMGEEESIV